MVDKREIMELLKKYFKTTGSITIDDHGLVTCTGSVDLKQQKKWERLPVSFGSVDRRFSCNNNQLTTLAGAPQSVGGMFLCNNNQLTTLEGAPHHVGESFDCSENQLTSLTGAPWSVGGDFSCSTNQLTTLEHAPKNVGHTLWCHANPLTTLDGLTIVPGTLLLSYSPTLPLLRCLLAKRVEFFPKLKDTTIENILNKYAGQGKRGAIKCQKELISAGFEGNAQW
jgi:hypothetical protein